MENDIMYIDKGEWIKDINHENSSLASFKVCVVEFVSER